MLQDPEKSVRHYCRHCKLFEGSGQGMRVYFN